MRLLYLTPGCFDKGGISRYSRYQILAWRELLGDANVRVLSLMGPDTDSFEEPFAVHYYAGGASNRYRPAYVWHSFKEAAGWRPDVIHTAQIGFAGMAKALSSAIGAKSILNMYGLDAWSGFRRRDVKWGLLHCDFVLSDCHFTARYLEQEGFRPARSVAVLWDCVDLNRFSPGPARPETLQRYGVPDPSTGFNLLTLGRMSPEAAHKGYERLYDVFRRIAPVSPSVRLIFAGKGDLATTLRLRAEADGLKDRVFFTGMVHEDDLPCLYRSAHLFSLVSDRGIWRGEGLPLTPLEAASCGVPILVGNQDGSQEAVVEGTNGHILDPFDLDAHADAILALVRSPDLRARMGREARARSEREFAYPIFREKHRALLRNWLGEEGRLSTETHENEFTAARGRT
jgi:phosphatidylinositol alpha-1,6-mannosyltransferase